MWLLTRCPAARAAIRESSPARTVAQTTRASWRALSPGWLGLLTPSICRYRGFVLEGKKYPKNTSTNGSYVTCSWDYLQTGLLWRQVGASSHSAELYRRHSATDVQVLPTWTDSLHLSNAVRASHCLSWVLNHNTTNTCSLIICLFVGSYTMPQT